MTDDMSTTTRDPRASVDVHLRRYGDQDLTPLSCTTTRPRSPGSSPSPSAERLLGDRQTEAGVYTGDKAR